MAQEKTRREYWMQYHYAEMCACESNVEYVRTVVGFL